jgi:hypothetical protein
LSAIRKAVNSYITQTVKPLTAQVQAAQLRAELAENPEIKPYEKEVKKLLAQLPEDQRLQPGMVSNAIDYVRKQHSEELLEAKVNAKVEEILKQRTSSAKEPADFSEGSTSTAASAGTKRTTKISARKYEEYREKASRAGMDVKDYIKFVVKG